MEERLKQRLVGAVVLVSLAVVFLPFLLDAPQETSEDVSVRPIPEIPERPRDRVEPTIVTTLNLPQTPRLDAEVERERNRQASSAPAEDRGAPSDAPVRESVTVFADAPARVSVSASSETESTPAATSDQSAIPLAAVAESPAPAALPPSDAPATKPRTEAPATAAGQWSVQLGSFQIARNARALYERLRASGYSAFVDTGSSSRGEVSRVFVGPMPDRAQAKDSAAKLRREMKLEGIVVPYPGG